MTTKPAALFLSGKNAESFSKALQESKTNSFNYSKEKEDSLKKLTELTKLLIEK